MDASKINIFSFFSGSGFLDLGFEKSGYKTAFVNEIHEPFLSAYKYSRNKMGIPEPVYGYHNDSMEVLLEPEKSKDLKSKISALKEKSEIVGFIGGPPCPDFSVAGKNKGQEGDNGRLSGSYVDAIIKFNPDFFLFENVKGLWRTKKHREFYDSLKQKLQEAGYVLTDRLINAIEYGAPQDRSRIIMIGFHRNFLKTYRPSWLKDGTVDIPEGIFPWLNHVKYDAKSVFAIEWPKETPFENDSNSVCPPNVNKELTVQHWFDQNDVMAHPNAEHAFTPKAMHRFGQIPEGDTNKKSYKRLHRWRYSPTASYGNNEVHLHPYKPRRISAAEALALQTLPKEFELPQDMTLSNMFKTIGNGVPFVASRGLAQTILEFITSLSQQK